MEAPCVLHIEADRVGVQIGRVRQLLFHREVERWSSEVRGMSIGDELSDIRGVNESSRECSITEVILQAAIFKAEFQTMVSMCPGKVVSYGKVSINAPAGSAERGTQSSVGE